MIPKNNKSYALEKKNPADKRPFKKVHPPNIFHPPTSGGGGGSIPKLNLQLYLTLGFVIKIYIISETDKRGVNMKIFKELTFTL